MKKDQKYDQTAAIRSQSPRSLHREHSTPIFITSSFVFDTQEYAADLFDSKVEGNIYSRYSNPNQDEFIQKMCILERCEDGIPTASGMSAVFLSMISLLKSGDHLLMSSAVFGSIYQIAVSILPRFNIEYTLVDDPTNLQGWEKGIRPNTALIFYETPSNPGLVMVDMEKLGQLASANGIKVAVDNCFATPYLQNPIDFGVDLIIHSATKFIDGQGRVLGGAVLGKKDLIEELLFVSKHTGPSISPFNAWILSKSLETLSIRMDKHCSNAESIAFELEKHRKIEEVRYPGLKSYPQFDLARKQMKKSGAIISIQVQGGSDGARKFCNGLQMVSRSSNLGDTRTIATHPQTTTHSKLPVEFRKKIGITDGLVRISVGLEDSEDILEDILQSLDSID